MNAMDCQFNNKGSHHATGCDSDHATGYTASSFLTPRSTMPHLSSPIWSASPSSCSPIPSGMTPSTSSTAFHSGEASGQNMTRPSSFQYNSSKSGGSPVQLGNQQRLPGDKTDISPPINHVTRGVSRLTQCDTYTTSDAYSMLYSGESIHQRSMHHGSMHQGSMHQGSKHQGSMHRGSMHHGVWSSDPHGSDSQWNYIRQTPLQASWDQHQQPAIRSSQDFHQQQQPIQIPMNTYHPQSQRSSHQLPSCQYQRPSCQYQLPSCQYQQPLIQFPSDQHLQPSFQPSDGFNQLQSNHLFPPTSNSKHVGLAAGALFSTCNGKLPHIYVDIFPTSPRLAI